MSTKTLTFPMYGRVRWSCTFEDDKPVAFDVAAVTPAAIAHGLSLVNRFCGATTRGYSVAEHSVLLADWVKRAYPEYDDIDLLACLLHDAPEAMGVADCHGPLKKLIAQPTRAFESSLSEALWRHLIGEGGLSWANLWAPLHGYDSLLGDWEAGYFNFPADLSGFADKTDRPLPAFPVMASAPVAEAMWLQKWGELA